MVETGEIGDVVIYTGNFGCANSGTKQLMKRYLVKYELYTISRISFWENFPFYEFLECAGYRYPSESFSRNYRDHLIKKYKLK